MNKFKFILPMLLALFLCFGLAHADTLGTWSLPANTYNNGGISGYPTCFTWSNTIYCSGGQEGTTIHTASLIGPGNTLISTWGDNSNSLVDNLGLASSCAVNPTSNPKIAYVYCAVADNPIGLPTNIIDYAEINGGNLYAWAQSANTFIPPLASNTFSSSFEGGSCNINNNVMYCTLGVPLSPQDQVGNAFEQATITNNVLMQWQTDNNFPTNTFGGSCVINPTSNTAVSYLYCATGDIGGGNAKNTIEQATITNNAVGPWSTANSLIGQMRRGSCVLESNNIFCGIGNNGAFGGPNYPGNEVDKVTITNNVIGTWIIANSFGASNEIFGDANSCIEVNNYMYCMLNSATVNTVVAQIFSQQSSSSTANTPTLIATPNPFLESNIIIDVGQYATLNTIISNGIAPYSGNWAWTPPNTLLLASPANTINNGILTGGINNAQLSFNGYAATNEVFTFGGTKYSTNALGTNTLTGVWTFVFGGFDSAHNTIVTSTNSITLNPALVAGAPTQSNVIIDLLQYSVQTSNPSGGTPGYTYQWYSNTIAAPFCDATNTIAGATSSTYTAEPLTTTNYAYKVSDSATTSNSACSTSDTVIVYPTPIGTLTFSNTLLDSGQTENALLSITGGIGPFSANLINTTNGGNLRQGISNIIITSNSAGTNSITFVVHSPTNSNSFTMNYLFSDGGDTTNDLFNSITQTFTVNTAFNTLSISTPTPSTQAAGNTVTFSTSFTGGTSAFTYNWNIYNTITGAIVANLLESNNFRGNSLSYTLVFGNTINANVVITDSASTPVTVNSVKSGTITIVPAPTYIPPTTPTFSASNNFIDQGQSILFSANIVTGQGTPNYAYAYNVYATNAGTVTLIANQLYTGNSFTSNTWFWTPNPNLYLRNTLFFANVVVVDANPTTVNSVANSFGYNGVFLPGTPTESNSIIDTGQKILQTANPSQGTGPYVSYQWYTNYGASVGCPGSGNAITGATSSTYLASPTTSNAYAYKVSDSATTANTNVCSSIDTETTNSIPTANIIIIGNTLLDSGQTFTTKFLTSGGTSPFTASLINITGNSKQNGQNNVLVFTIGGSNTISFTVSSPNNANTFTFSYNGVDYGTTSNFIFNSPYNSITVNAALSVSISPATNSFVVGNSQTLTATVTGGTLPLTYNWLVTNSAGFSANLLATMNAIRSNTFTFTPLATGTYNVNVVVTDSATVKTQATTSNSIITVNSNAIPSYSSSGGFSVALGTNTLLSGTCVGTDTCNIIIAGTQVASSSNTVTYNFQSVSYGIGIFKIKFCDANTMLCTPDPFLSVYIPVYLQNATNNPALTFPTSMQSACANTLGGFCMGNDILSTSGTLTSSLYVNGNILITAGTTIVSNGFSIITSGIFNSIGATIFTGNNLKGGNSAGNSNGGNSSYGIYIQATTIKAGTINAAGQAGTNINAGNGGGNGANGGNTLANGGIGGVGTGISGTSGSNTLTAISNANIIYWFNNGLQNYIAGASGGGGSPNPGSAINGISNPLSYAGSGGGGGSTGSGTQTGGGGGGGGGIIILASSITGTYVPGVYSVLGGAGGPANGGGAGGAGGNGIIYVYSYSSPPIPGAQFQEYYPYEIYTTSPAPIYNFSLYQNYNGITTSLVSNAANLGYIPLPSQNPGFYSYNVFEFSQGNVGISNMLQLNLTINMTDISNSLTTNSPTIQYYPNIANITKGSFTAQPINWKLWSYPNTLPLAYGVNTIQGSVFSSNVVTFPVNVQLVYSFTSFNISLLNNPKVQTTITQNAFTFYPSNTAIGTGIYTRQLLNVTNYNQSTLLQSAAITNLYESWLVNNYTASNSLTYTSTTFNVYIGNSNYFNPSLLSTLLTTTTSNTGYIQSLNNFCPTTVSSSPASIGAYLIATGLGAQYTTDISSGFSAAANGDFLQIFSGPSRLTATKVQQVSITTTSFTIPLIVGGIYGFSVVGPHCNSIYATNFSTWTSPIFINIPLNNTVSNVIIPNPIIKCTITYNSIAANDMLVCTGKDASNLINKWNITLFNESSFIIPLVLANTINGTILYYQNSMLSNVVDYTVVVGYSTANGIFGTKAFQFPVQYKPGFESALDGFATFIILLLFLAFGVGLAQTQEGAVHAMSNTLYLLGVGVFVCFMLSFTQGLGVLINAGVIVFLLAIGFYVMNQENKSQYYRQ